MDPIYNPYSNLIFPSFKKLTETINMDPTTIQRFFNYDSFPTFLRCLKPLVLSYDRIERKDWMICSRRINEFLFPNQTEDDQFAFIEFKYDLSEKFDNILFVERVDHCRKNNVNERLHAILSGDYSEDQKASILQKILHLLIAESKTIRLLIEKLKEASAFCKLHAIANRNVIEFSSFNAYEIPSESLNKMKELTQKITLIKWKSELGKNYIYLALDKNFNYTKYKKQLEILLKKSMPDNLKLCIESMLASVEVKFILQCKANENLDLINEISIAGELFSSPPSAQYILATPILHENYQIFKNPMKGIKPEPNNYSNFKDIVICWETIKDDQKSFFDFVVEELNACISKNGPTFIKYSRELNAKTPKGIQKYPIDGIPSRSPLEWGFNFSFEIVSISKSTLKPLENHTVTVPKKKKPPTHPKPLQLVTQANLPEEWLFQRTDQVKRWGEMLPLGRRLPKYTLEDNHPPLKTLHGYQPLVDQFYHLGTIEDWTTEDQRIAIPAVLTCKKAIIIGTLFFRINPQSGKGYHSYIEMDREGGTAEPFIPVKIEHVAKFDGRTVAYNKNGDVLFDDPMRQMSLRLENMKKTGSQFQRLLTL